MDAAVYTRHRFVKASGPRKDGFKKLDKAFTCRASAVFRVYTLIASCTIWISRSSPAFPSTPAWRQK